MRITGPGASNNTSNIKKRKNVSKPGDFGKMLSGAGEPDEATDVSEATSLGAMNSLLALQEVEQHSLIEDAKERGNQLLDHLDDIRHGLLNGTISQERIQEINNLINEARPEVDDPELNAILDEIEIRAAVEAAKWERDED